MAMRWFSVSVLSNYEKRVAEQIKALVVQKGLDKQIKQIVVPTETVAEYRRGKPTDVERRLLPGYIMIRMQMTDEGYHLIKSVNRVMGFLGPEGKPSPMPDVEVDAILQRVEKGAEQPRTLIMYDVGEMVNVTDGPFEGFSGMVEEVDAEAARLKVSVSIFGRATPVDLEYSQVTKQT
ncbi:MAG: transcription termination/antitermination protein NusG [Rhodobacteraceae bacterium]|nr:transcription termination/antitermination protein NusG [Paracoccaceae bacterium]